MALVRGRYTARLAQSTADIDRAQALRWRCFRGGGHIGGHPGGRDADRFDAGCRHILLERSLDRELLGCFRLSVMDGPAVRDSYSAQHYDLSRLAACPGPKAEVGRFCIAPGTADPDLLRLAWGAIAGIVSDEGVAFLFGCSSFPGTDPARYRDAFAVLASDHRAPEGWRPGPLASERIDLVPGAAIDRAKAFRTMPPLLKTYLSMGGRVGNHAVIDRELQTLHIFVGLDTAAVPAARARSLMAIAGVP